MKLFNTCISAFVVLMLLGFFPSPLKAQQEPAFSHYMYNPLVYNPAVAGTSESINSVLLSRFQWVGFDDAPRSNMFSIHSPSPVYQDNIGLGLTFVNDSWGPLQYNNVGLNYSFRTQVHDGGWLAMGLNTTVEFRRLEMGGLNPLDPNDPSYYGHDDLNHTSLNFGAGFYYFTDNYYLGFSIPKLRRVAYNRDISTAPYEQNERHFFLSGGYLYSLNQDWDVQPNFITRLVPGTPFSMDLGVNATWQQMLVSGLSYRWNEAVSLMFQVNVFEYIWFGYAYDYGIGSLGAHHSGSHELLLRFDYGINN